MARVCRERPAADQAPTDTAFGAQTNGSSFRVLSGAQPAPPLNAHSRPSGTEAPFAISFDPYVVAENGVNILVTSRGTFQSDDRRTHWREATQSLGHSSPAGRSPAPRRPLSDHTDPPGSTRPSSADAGSGAPAIPPFSAPVPNPRAGCQRACPPKPLVP